MFKVGREIIPFFAACSPLWEILQEDKRFIIISGDEGKAKEVVDTLNLLVSGGYHGDNPQDPDPYHIHTGPR
jgi:hypothetical protein